MLEILEYATSGFCKFLGCLIIISIVLHYIVNGIMNIWSRFMRMLMVRKHGWPPDYLDADGDHKINFLKNEN